MAILEQQATPQNAEAHEEAGWRDALERRKQWMHEECLQLEQAELLTEQYELLDGEIICKMGQNLPHAQAVMRILRALTAVFGLDRLLSPLPLMLSRTRLPEPDAIVLTHAFETYSGLATGKDALLVMKVSDDTVRPLAASEAVLSIGDLLP